MNGQTHDPTRDVLPMSGELLALIPRKRAGDEQQLRVTLDRLDGAPFVRLSVWRRNTEGRFYPERGKSSTIRQTELPTVLRALREASKLVDAEGLWGATSTTSTSKRPDRLAPGPAAKPSKVGWFESLPPTSEVAPGGESFSEL